MSDLNQAMFNIINFPDDIPNALIDDLATVMEAARLVANPNIVEVMAKAMFDAQPSGIEWDQASEEARNFWRIFAKAAVAAAVTPQGDTDGT